jgi:hypothetical protein
MAICSDGLGMLGYERPTIFWAFDNEHSKRVAIFSAAVVNPPTLSTQAAITVLSKRLCIVEGLFSSNGYLSSKECSLSDVSPEAFMLLFCIYWK